MRTSCGSSLGRVSWNRRMGRTEIDKPRQEGQHSGLVEHLVEIAALRALHTRGAPRAARAAAQQRSSVPHPAFELIEPAFGDPNTAGVTVVDENGRPPGF